MERTRNISFIFRKLTGVFIILALLAFFLGFYFLKYIPDRRNSFHRSAFQELSQIEGALQDRNEAFRRSILSFLSQSDSISKSPLLQFFHYRSCNLYSPKLYAGKPLEVRETRFEQDSITGVWQISYLLYRNNVPVGALSKNLDTLMTRMVNTYKDIFDGYLLIKDRGDYGNKGFKETDSDGNARVIFNSSGLTVDYRVNTDSLLKKTDGFSYQGVHDVFLEGNSYKLFMFPVEVGRERIILAGLISLKKYAEGYNTIPFNFIAFAGVLILLLLIHLPVLKIYLLGAFERIRDIDIRLIIGTYFIAAFVGFFLFSKVFLDQAEIVEDNQLLRSFSANIQQNLLDETDSVCAQLQEFDSLFRTVIIPSGGLMRMVRAESDSLSDYKADSIQVDSVLNPVSYPYLDNVFWIDSTGHWVARWAFRKTFARTPLIRVDDRKYFKDFKLRQTLILHTRAKTIPFTIQPTLSKLDGEYTITIVTSCDSSTVEKCRSSYSGFLPPKLVGLGAPMHFVCHPVLPPGFNFSIINDKGDVLFDSKPGRALLSNIANEMNDPADILQCARYHTERFFDLITFRGRQMTLLAEPMQTFPYTLLVYYRFPESDGFQEHLIGLSAFLTGCILLLLISTSLINEWTKRKPRLLHIPLLHFEWIYPTENKIPYYRHLARWMFRLFTAYLLIWVAGELFFRKNEFTLFFITLEFPFFIALHYYILRENFSALLAAGKENNRIVWFPAQTITMMIAVILLFIVFLAFWKDLSFGNFLLLSLAQAGFLGVLIRSIRVLIRDYKPPGRIPESIEPAVVTGVIRKKRENQARSMLKGYIVAVLTGVMMISVIPASGIFWLIFKQEINLDLFSDQLSLVRSVNLRRAEINDRLPQYKKAFASGLSDLKFKYGIYTPTSHGIDTTGPFNGPPFYSVSPAYCGLHRRFFPRDSIMLAWTNQPGFASDSSWYFFSGTDTGYCPSQLVYRAPIDGYSPQTLRLEADRSSCRNAAGLMMNKIWSLGLIYFLLYFGSLVLSIALAYRLTASLARRIFLMDLFDTEACRNETKGMPDEYLAIYASQDDLEQHIGRKGPFNVAAIREYEKRIPRECLDEKLMGLEKMLSTTYSKIWEELSPREKFILYDFALDGFANYKNADLLHGLLERGILRFDDHRLSFSTLSFREFVLKNNQDTGINTFMEKAAKEDSWKNFKTPLMLILAAIGLFIFITQDAIYQKITGLLTSISSLLPLFTNLFGKSGDSSRSGGSAD